MKLTFLSSQTEESDKWHYILHGKYGWHNPYEADVVVALGGDGFVLSLLHKDHFADVPIFGLNTGTLGFLSNEVREDGLIERIEGAREEVLHPLKIHTEFSLSDYMTPWARAYNELSLIRSSAQAANLNIHVNGQERMTDLICDGVLVATPAGSTAYNLSAHGPIIPLGTDLLALTPLSPFRPRRWRGALLPDDSTISITVNDPEKRPVTIAADSAKEAHNVKEIYIAKDKAVSRRLLFDHDHSLEERVIREQFE